MGVQARGTNRVKSFNVSQSSRVANPIIVRGGVNYITIPNLRGFVGSAAARTSSSSSIMGKKKSSKMVESDSDLRFGDDVDDRITHVVNDDNDGDFHDENTDDAQEEDAYDDNDIGDGDGDGDGDENEVEDEDNSEEEGSEEDNEEGVPDDEDVLKGEEMEELEKEYRELKNEEQDLWRNLKRHKDEDLQKGQAVKIKGYNEPVRSLFCDTDSEVSEAYSDLVASSKKTLDCIMELQQKFEAGNSNGDVDEEWLQISQMQSRMASFRNKSIDKWQRKTQVTTGTAAIKDKLHAFNQSISEQVAAYMRDPSKMIKGMQQNRSAVAVFGNVDSTENIKQEETYANGDPELLDDSDFYQQLLKEFFETIDPSSSETAFYALKRLQTKKRKIVDRRASKSRKIRYNVHEKIVNFMAPRPTDVPPMASKLFENLFVVDEVLGRDGKLVKFLAHLKEDEF
ncbi:hypothetical protein DH2020_044693 [Rehmannia glutinosa]|uniref:Uncharacterized protein n=1 Tax=Rehmannia glutinosa TaxID=99300 RepID=A0ABR0UGZ4_REHGL